MNSLLVQKVNQPTLLNGMIIIERCWEDIFGNPTLSETFFEAALATDGEAIHLLMDDES